MSSATLLLCVCTHVCDKKLLKFFFFFVYVKIVVDFLILVN